MSHMAMGREVQSSYKGRGMIILNNNVKRYALDWYINVGGQKSHSVCNLQLKLLISMSDTLWKRPAKGSVQFMRRHGRHQVQPSKEEGKKGMPGAEPAYRPRTLSSGPETPGSAAHSLVLPVTYPLAVPPPQSAEPTTLWFTLYLHLSFSTIPATCNKENPRFCNLLYNTYYHGIHIL